MWRRARTRRRSRARTGSGRTHAGHTAAGENPCRRRRRRRRRRLYVPQLRTGRIEGDERRGKGRCVGPFWQTERAAFPLYAPLDSVLYASVVSCSWVQAVFVGSTDLDGYIDARGGVEDRHLTARAFVALHEARQPLLAQARAAVAAEEDAHAAAGAKRRAGRCRRAWDVAERAGPAGAAGASPAVGTIAIST